MPIVRTLRAIAAACLALTLLLAIAGPVAALAPPRPLPEYRPTFVTQTDQHPMRDCLWASAAMLLDKWTNGDVIRTHQQLRALSRDRRGGSTFEDLHVAFARLGFDVPATRAGDRLTWGELLARLRNGAGAIVLGDYGDLPRWYGRWDIGFWKSERPGSRPKARPGAAAPGDGSAVKPAAKPGAKPPSDNHAVYVERYEPRRGRVWLMDPLGRNGWRGEWVSVRALKRFAWSSGGRVYAVTTPTAAPAPFGGVRFTDPKVGLSEDAVTASWRVRSLRHWRYPGADLHVSFIRASSPLVAAAWAGLEAPGVTTDAAPAAPTSGVAGSTLRLTAALPKAPGAYLTSMSLTDRRFGRQVVASDEIPVFVPGEQRAVLRLNVLDDVLTAGGPVMLNVSVSNAGRETWADDPVAALDNAIGPRTRTGRATRLVAHWIRLDQPVGGPDGTAGDDATADEARPAAVDLLDVPLAPGDLARYRGEIRVPEALGRWALVVDVQDELLGSYAALGNAPAVAVFEVVPPRGIEAVD